jgi:hypothetical protein
MGIPLDGASIHPLSYLHGQLEVDVPPKKESSYDVSLEGQKGGNKWAERTSLQSRSSRSLIAIAY